MGSLNNTASFESSPEMEKFLCDRLLDQNQPISKRFRALFSLRNLKGSAPRNALILERFTIAATRDSSNLLAHEAAFALGQMQDADAVPALEAVLNDLSLHPIIRHEVTDEKPGQGLLSILGRRSVILVIRLGRCADVAFVTASAAEALGAIGLESNVPLLRNSLASDPAQEVRETCELALERIEQLKVDSGKSTIEKSPFMSVDPAAASASCSSVAQLRDVLLDEEKGMYERYASLFALRNNGGVEAVAAIIDSLGSKSALLKHEVAYVLGQLQNKAASAALSSILKDVNEHPMVRHEAAEALGSIADDESISLLKEFASDSEPIVSESCEVALSMLEFERSGKSFEYIYVCIYMFGGFEYSLGKGQIHTTRVHTGQKFEYLKVVQVLDQEETWQAIRLDALN
ncbi:hypothetical protein L484_026376 [Morus notabilis]|uniref:Deoxyhypusine hydroxylase n=1 Tax=Morus notabilis TaxID=981085 RepID=W9R8I1_9ROSA|nr:hypothetical protein L484_026376 [Morus notabilis]